MNSLIDQVYTVQKLLIITLTFVLTTLYTLPGLIISHLVGHYLNIYKASTVNFKIYIFQIN